MPENDDRSPPLVVDFTEPPPGGNRHVENIFHRSRVALENRVLSLPVPVLDGKGADAQLRAEETHARRNRFYMRQIFHGHRIFERQLLAGAHLFAGSAECEGFDVKGKNNIRTHAADELANIVIQPAHDGGNSDYHGDTDHDAQHRQAGTQFVAANGVQRHPDDFAVVAQIRKSVNPSIRQLLTSSYISYRSAAIGSSMAARRAGYTPKNTPTLAETINPAATAHNLITEGIPIRAVMPLAKVTPKITPKAPPTSDMVADSIRNCNSTSERRAPIALRIPTSRVRSVTETSMIFMMTMPPTTSEIAAIPIMATKNVPLRLDQMPSRLALVSMSKLSPASGGSWRRARSTARASSMAASSEGPTPAALPEMRMLLSCVPYCFR